MSETQTIHYFYKGYSIGCTDKELSVKLEECGKNMVDGERKKGRSDADIIEKYLYKMNMYWDDLKRLPVNEGSWSMEDLKRMCDSITYVENEAMFLVVWATTLIALLELGAIPEDNDNGLLTQKQGPSYVIFEHFTSN